MTTYSRDSRFQVVVAVFIALMCTVDSSGVYYDDCAWPVGYEFYWEHNISTVVGNPCLGPNATAYDLAARCDKDGPTCTGFQYDEDTNCLYEFNPPVNVMAWLSWMERDYGICHGFYYKLPTQPVAPPKPVKPPPPPPAPLVPPADGDCSKCMLGASFGGCHCNSHCTCVYDWPTFGFDSARSGHNPNEIQINSANVANLTVKSTRALAGTSIDQVVVAAQVHLGNGTYRDVAYVGDNNGLLSALDADTLAVIWTANLGKITSPCLDLPNGRFGVAGTPVVDRDAGALFAVNAKFEVFALNLSTGAMLKGNWGKQFPSGESHDSMFMYGAMTLNPKLRFLYLPKASVCNNGTINEGISALDADWEPVKGTYRSSFSPNISPLAGGGIRGMGGVSVDPTTGSVLAATSNSQGPVRNVGFARHVVRLHAHTLAVLQSFMPNMGPDGDDFGATPVPFHPNRTCKHALVAVGHRRGILYVLNAMTMRKIQALQVSNVTSRHQFVASPAWHSGKELLIVVSPEDSPDGTLKRGLVAFRVNGNCSLSVAWNTALGESWASHGDVVFSSPTLAGGLVFVTAGVRNVTYAMDVSNGKLLWTATPPGATFIPPTVVNGKVYIVSGGWGGGPSVVQMYSLPK